ncbi:hypothetical protein SAMN04489720_1599 [Agrococcus jejuensis]|uniref:Uncharacterized protein n=1 Tax=Agrococcus jejuensis TaxID=399736 RepID=A0A1G8DD12_9MICO|nr:hypothetical protein SAMN04489720_1599 [Agrococcus jejuensis]
MHTWAGAAAVACVRGSMIDPAILARRWRLSVAQCSRGSRDVPRETSVPDTTVSVTGNRRPGHAQRRQRGDALAGLARREPSPSSMLTRSDVQVSHQLLAHRAVVQLEHQAWSDRASSSVLPSHVPGAAHLARDSRETSNAWPWTVRTPVSLSPGAEREGPLRGRRQQRRSRRSEVVSISPSVRRGWSSTKHDVTRHSATRAAVHRHRSSQDRGLPCFTWNIDCASARPRWRRGPQEVTPGLSGRPRRGLPSRHPSSTQAEARPRDVVHDQPQAPLIPCMPHALRVSRETSERPE